VLAYNIPGVKNLVLTREQIVGIYNGSISSWNDSVFAEHNPGVELPNATVVPVARFESSGSTEIFTKSLSSFSDAWAAQYGVFSKASGWNDSVVRLFAERNSGMADIVRREPYRVGYMTPASAVEVNLPFASVVNRRGRVTVANERSVQAAMDERSQGMSSRLTSDLVDCEGDETYPIAGYSYFIVTMTHSGNCSAVIELARYIEWFLDGSQAKEELEHRLVVPVSRSVADRIRSAVLERMTCDGRLLMDLVRQQKYEEEESLKTWKLPVQIVSPLTAFIILLLVVYAIRQRVQYLKISRGSSTCRSEGPVPEDARPRRLEDQLLRHRFRLAEEATPKSKRGRRRTLHVGRELCGPLERSRGRDKAVGHCTDIQCQLHEGEAGADAHARNDRARERCEILRHFCAQRHSLPCRAALRQRYIGGVRTKQQVRPERVISLRRLCRHRQGDGLPSSAELDSREPVD